MSEQAPDSPVVATEKCEACDGKGGWVTAEWTDPVSGPEQEIERCEDCEGTGRFAATLPAAPAPTEQQDELPITRSTYGSLEACEAEQARRNAVPTEQAELLPLDARTTSLFEDMRKFIHNINQLAPNNFALADGGRVQEVAASLLSRAALAARLAPTEAPTSIDTAEFREKLCSVFAVKTLLYSGALPALIAHINDWAARQAPDSRDAERLDWLIKEECMVENLALSDTRYRIRWPNLEEAQTDWFKNARDAIDAAGDQEKAQ